MAGHLRSGVKVTLGGRQRTLRYDLNALAELEEATGTSLAELQSKTVGLRFLRALVWAGLLHQEPDLTQREVGAWIDGENLQEVQDAAVKALTAAFSQASEGDQGNDSGPEAGPGTMPSA